MKLFDDQNGRARVMIEDAFIILTPIILVIVATLWFLYRE